METKHKGRALTLLALGGVASAAIATAIIGGSGTSVERASAAELEPFSSCDELLTYARDHRWARNAYPYMEGDIAFAASADSALEASSARVTALPATDEAAVGASETGTNTQEVGIDEPDIAKLSGTTLFRIKGNTLTSYDVAGTEAVQLDEIKLASGSYDSQLLIAGDRALVISTGYATADESATTTITELDVTDPMAMTADRELEVEGSQVSARLRESTVRFVIESQPDYPGVRGGGGGPEPEPLPEEDLPESGATGETGPEPQDNDPEWLPQATLTDLETGESATSPLLGCEDVSVPAEFSGLGILSVLTIDLAEELLPSDVDAVMTDGTTVYASATSLYVATAKLSPPKGAVSEAIGSLIAPDMTTVPFEPVGETAIHRFETGDSTATEYAASGEVRGNLIGHFAMSEEDGILRVASTEGDAFVEGAGESESMITTLAEDDGTLEELGRVDGLGPGEDIYAVRFIGDMGYVVTFEQTDPLYTVDISDPQNPRTTGELKIPGYSAYLHPVADGRLLGIGQAGRADGTITGAQASLFDVADPEQPEQLDTLDLADGRYSSTSTERDHHAFMYSPEHALAVVPVQSYGRRGLQGAVAMQVDPDGGLTEAAELEDAGQIERVLVVKDNLVTVSTRGVGVRALAEL
jgi:uncharacterized secreted protein with C-terminal beta-propeller domain